MRRPAIVFGALLSLCWLAACAVPAPPPPPEDAGAPRSATVRVTSNGWHSGIALPRSAVAAGGLIPEIADFPDAEWLVFGWGDAEYYRAAEATIGMTLDAALLPTRTVMHVRGLERPPEQVLAETEVATLAVTPRGLASLVRAIAAQFDRPAEGSAAPVPGGGPGRFYPAEGRFHLGNTCNTWTARMLHAAGVDIVPGDVVTAGDLMARLRPLARVG